MRTVSTSRPREAECIKGPLAGLSLPTAADVQFVRIWEPPAGDPRDFVYSADSEPDPAACKLLGTYRVGTGAMRGKLLWEAAE